MALILVALTASGVPLSAAVSSVFTFKMKSLQRKTRSLQRKTKILLLKNDNFADELVSIANQWRWFDDVQVPFD